MSMSSGWLMAVRDDVDEPVIDADLDLDGVIEQALSRFGERDAARGARKERDAEARLELAHGLAQGSRGDTELARGCREAAAAGDGEEGIPRMERCEGHRQKFLHDRMPARTVASLGRCLSRLSRRTASSPPRCGVL